jgi:hypothetical protein
VVQVGQRIGELGSDLGHVRLPLCWCIALSVTLSLSLLGDTRL